MIMENRADLLRAFKAAYQEQMEAEVEAFGANSYYFWNQLPAGNSSNS